MLTLCLGAPSSLTPLINDSCFTTVANRQLSTGADGFDRAPTQESWRLSQTEPYIPSHLRSESCESIRQEKWGSCHPLLTCWISGLTEKPYGTPVWSPLWIVCAVLGLSAPDLIPPQGVYLGAESGPPLVVDFSQWNPCWQSALNCCFLSFPLFLFFCSFFPFSSLPSFFRQTWEMCTQGGRGLF